VQISVYQGERELVKDNKALGTFNLTGIPPAPRGVPQIEVSFDIDANGIVNVSAKDKASGKDQSITIVASSGLSKDEIEKMVHDAEAFAESDAKKRELIETVNSAEGSITDIEKNLTQFAAQLDKTEEAKVRTTITELREVMKSSEEVEAIKSKLNELNQASMNLFSMVYQKKMNENKSSEPKAEDVDFKDANGEQK
jgi:molecular chaperone DnaK